MTTQSPETACIRLGIPEELGRYCDGSDRFEMIAVTWNEAVSQLVNQFPDIESRLLRRDGKLKAHLIVFCNGASVHAAELPSLAVSPGDELEIMFAISGG